MTATYTQPTLDTASSSILSGAADISKTRVQTAQDCLQTARYWADLGYGPEKLLEALEKQVRFEEGVRDNLLSKAARAKAAEEGREV